MPTQTQNLKLKLYDAVTDAQERFINFRDDLAGTGESNMKKIDDFAGAVNTALENAKYIHGVNNTKYQFIVDENGPVLRPVEVT